LGPVGSLALDTKKVENGLLFMPTNRRGFAMA
jgi:hypothetical protein